MWLGSGCRREDGKEEVDEGGMESRMSRVDEGRGLPEWPAGSLPIWGRYQRPVLKPNASFDQSVTLTTPLFPRPPCMLDSSGLCPGLTADWDMLRLF
jgi:hypothetical protein